LPSAGVAFAMTNEAIVVRNVGTAVFGEIEVTVNEPGVVVRVTPVTGVSIQSFLNGVNTTFRFTGGMDGIWRTYTGNHFSIDANSSSDSGSGNFTLRLQRNNGVLPATTVGSVNLPQNGRFHVEFLHVNRPNQQYRVTFAQNFMQSSLQQGTMTIWNWW
jgi:hypothetical protein